MKKLIPLALILCMACMLISATAENIDVTGEWHASVMGVPMTMTLNADGTGTLSMPGQTESISLTWSLDAGQLSLAVGESEPAVCPVTAEGFMLSDTESGLEMKFTREVPEPIAMGAPVAAETEDAFLGSWNCKYIESEDLILDPGAFGYNLPGIRLADSSVTFIGPSEEDEMAGMYNMLSLVYIFGDGKLVLSSNLEGAGITGDITLLDDGMARLSLVLGEDASIFYYIPAEAAEEPAS